MRSSSIFEVAILALLLLCIFIVPSENITPEAEAAYEQAAYKALMATLPSAAPATPTPLATAVPTADPAATESAIEFAKQAPTPEPTVAYSLDMNTYEGGYAPSESGYYTETITLADGTTADAECYSDETIEAKYFSQRYYHAQCNFAIVKIKDPSQLRTVVAKELVGSSSETTSKMASMLNAVVAINGEYYTKREGGVFIVKQSQIIKSTPSSSLHQLIIDTDGNFHITTSKSANTQAMADYNGRIYQAFSFGPALVVDGEMLSYSDYYFDADSGNPRTAIGQIGPLEYLVCAVNGRTGNDDGCNTDELAQIMYDKGCVNAYNLDGGGSSTLYWHGKVVNGMNKSGTERDISDIVYFASAYPDN